MCFNGISSAARNLVFPFSPLQTLSFRRRRKLRTGAWVDFQRRKTSHEGQFPNSFVGLMTFTLIRSFLAASTNAAFLLYEVSSLRRQMLRFSCMKFLRCVDKCIDSLVRSFLAALGMTGSWWREKGNTRFLASLEICTATQNDINNFFQNNKYNPYHFFRFPENSFVLFNQKN